MTTFASNQPILSWPRQLCPSSQQPLRPVYNTSVFTSPFTRTSQTQELPGAVFEWSADFPPLSAATAGIVRAWLAKLRGSAGRFYLPAQLCSYVVPSAYATERTTITTLRVDTTTLTADSTRITADATEITLEPVFVCDGLSTSPTTITGTLWINSNQKPLMVGGYVSFDDAAGWRHLHLVVDLVHLPSGYCTLTVEPPMRALPTSSTPLHVHAPSGIFMLTDDAQGTMQQGLAGRHSVQLSARQAFPARVVV